MVLVNGILFFHEEYIPKLFQTFTSVIYIYYQDKYVEVDRKLNSNTENFDLKSSNFLFFKFTFGFYSTNTAVQ